MQVDKVESQENCLVFHNDDYESCLINASWFGKKVPAKRRF